MDARCRSVLEAPNVQNVWLSTLPQRFVIILEKNRDRQESPSSERWVCVGGGKGVGLPFLLQSASF